MSVQIAIGDDSIEKGSVSVELELNLVKIHGGNYALGPNDDELIIYNTISQSESPADTSRIDAVLVHNFFDELRRLAPPD